MTLAAVLAIALMAVALCASASAAGGYQQATFKAEVKGTQSYKAEYHHESRNPCDVAIDDVNTETAKFKSTKPLLITFTKVPGMKEPLISAGKKPVMFPTKATVKRAASHVVGPIAGDCEDNGGGAEPGPGPDCGTKVVAPFNLDVGYFKPEHVELISNQDSDTDPFENCSGGKFPFLLSGDRFGKRSSAELPTEEVFDEKIGKLITIGKGTEFLPYGESNFEETNIRWELSLTRVQK